MERIEIDPLSVAKSTKLWLVKQKPVSDHEYYYFENILMLWPIASQIT